MDSSTLKEGFLGQKMIVLPNAVRKWMKVNPITGPFYITDIGYYPKASHHYRVRKRGAKEFIFIYCTEGEGTLSIDSHQAEVKPNHFFIVPKNTTHYYHANELNPWSIYWMHFDGSMAENLFDRYQSRSQKIGIIPFESERIKLFNQIFQIFKSDYVEPQMEYANILGLNFISSFIFREIDQSVGVHAGNNLVDAIIDFLNQNLDKSFKSEDIAEEFNYSPSYLFSLFKKRTGYSLIHFFNLKKIQKACEYLNYTDLTVKEIGYRMGFQDPLYFSRLFKKQMGVSPKTYKSELHN
ncbi:helix-turn-helix domain-containing protein [Fulvivirga sp. M361]|uniref:helix-turn-helix domain-containing protein n=1 Tax=Fulvivirga sp. M361 TaxID=2594266 RepID=UPI0011798DA8|nr:helix-turn-helix domain-containing protein [Fulvivirga sp. M361]TRX54759.1 helix-turn-helix domain-containing protein [Fulvivirga sp. M361]